MLKIEHGCIFLRRTGDELEGVALLTRQLENADDSIEFFIRRFRLGDIMESTVLRLALIPASY